MTVLIHAMAKALQAHGTRPMVIEGDKTLNRQELLVYGAAYAREFRKLGIVPGAHVAILLPNCIAWCGAELGALLLGAVAVPVNPLTPPAELAVLRKTGDFDVIVAGGPLLALAGTLEGAKVVDAATVTPGAEDVAAAPALLAEAVARAKPDDPAVIIFTSGTTGASKAAVLSQKNLGSNVEAALVALEVTHEDALQMTLPMFHSYGILGFNFMWMVGGFVVMIQRFSPGAVLEALAKHRTSILIMVPPMIALMAKTKLSRPDTDLSAVRLMVSGGTALPASVYELWGKVSNAPLINGYGQTEASPLISCNTPKLNRFPSVGIPIRDVDVRIWDDEGKELPIGEIGEIVCRGPNVMLGYYKDPAATAKTVTGDGWLRTGDFGVLNEEGILTITGRKKELIIVSGENVHPLEVEEVIAEVPGVLEVAVVAGYDDLRGEFVRACVAPVTELAEDGSKKPKVPEDQLRDAIMDICRKRLAPHKVPRTVEFLPALPRNTLGKILKRELEKRGPAKKA